MTWLSKKSLKRELDDLRRDHARAEEFITDILTYRAGEKLEESSSAGNPYRTRETLVAEIVLKYKGYSRWGNQLVQRIADTRSAFALGRGARARPLDSESDKPEAEFLKEFISMNGLDGSFAQQLGVEKELEGQVLLHIAPVFNNEDGIKIRASFVSWNDTHYEVEFKDGGYADILGVKWRDPASGETILLDPDEFVFMRFNAPANAREGVPNLSGLLVECEDIDKALRDWRAINRYFASPTPYFRTEDMAQARDLYEQLTDPKFNWKIGKVFTGPAEFSLVGMDAAGIDSIRQEIETKIKILAGGAGVPVQFLGFPEFMSSRATAENTMEPVELVALQERQSWKAGFRELYDKAIRMRNAYAPPSQTMLREGRVVPKIPFASSKQIDTLSKLYLPAFQAGALDHRAFLSLMPDSEEEY